MKGFIVSLNMITFVYRSKENLYFGFLHKLKSKKYVGL